MIIICEVVQEEVFLLEEELEHFFLLAVEVLIHMIVSALVSTPFSEDKKEAISSLIAV